jgi:hypothetical protein
VNLPSERQARASGEIDGWHTAFTARPVRTAAFTKAALGKH